MTASRLKLPSPERVVATVASVLFSEFLRSGLQDHKTIGVDIKIHQYDRDSVIVQAIPFGGSVPKDEDVVLEIHLKTGGRPSDAEVFKLRPRCSFYYMRDKGSLQTVYATDTTLRAVRALGRRFFADVQRFA